MVEHFYEIHRFLLNMIRHRNLRGKLIVDVGCGKGIWSYLVRVDIEGGNEARFIGLDIDLGALNFCKRHRTYDDLVLCDVRYLPLRKFSFDIVFACEIIEHLPKKEGYKFLDELEQIYKEAIILTTPNGYLPTPTSTVFHIHKSGWNINELRNRGYLVRGCGLRLANGILPFSPSIAMGLHYLATPFSYLLPYISGFIVATKSKNQIMKSRTLKPIV